MHRAAYTARLTGGAQLGSTQLAPLWRTGRYTPPKDPTKMVLTIKGADDPADDGDLETSLQNIDGVSSVTVSFRRFRTRLAYSPTAAQPTLNRRPTAAQLPLN